MKKLFIVWLVLVFTIGSVVYAQELEGNSLTGGVNSEAAEDVAQGIYFEFALGFSTTYLWRGIDYFAGDENSVFTLRPTINPSITFSTDIGFYVNIWASVALTERDIFADSDEIDVVLGYAAEGKYGAIDAGIAYYGYLGGYGDLYEIHAEFNPELELYFSYTAPVLFSPTVFVAVDEEVTFYNSYSLAYDLAFDIFDVPFLDLLTFSPSVLVGIWFPSRSKVKSLEPAVNSRIWAHLDITLPLSIDIYDGLSAFVEFTSSLRFFPGGIYKTLGAPIWVGVVNIGMAYNL